MRYFLSKVPSLSELCSRAHFNKGNRIWIIAPLLTPGNQIRLSHCHGIDDARRVTRMKVRYRFFCKLPLHGVSSPPLLRSKSSRRRTSSGGSGGRYSWRPTCCRAPRRSIRQLARTLVRYNSYTLYSGVPSIYFIGDALFSRPQLVARVV